MSNLDTLIRTAPGALQALHAEREIALDLETGGLDPFRDPIAVVTLKGAASGKRAVLHVRGRLPHEVKVLLENPVLTISGHNVTNFDALFLANHGVDVTIPKWFDTMTAELAVLQSGRRDLSVSLKAATERRTGKVLRKDADHSSWMNERLDERQLEYAVGDIDNLLELKAEQLRRADEVGVTPAIELEMQLIPTLLRMMLNGLPISVAKFDEYLTKQWAKAQHAERALAHIFGARINLNSPMQLRKAFAAIGVSLDATKRETLVQECLAAGIPVERGKEWTIDELLAAFKEGMPAAGIGILLTHRFANQRLKMYDSEWIRKYIHDGRLHARFWPLGTDTGRFSSSDPNLQQFPSDAREAARAEEGHLMVAGDYGQIEVRIMAAKANDPAMIAACEQSDMHGSIAAMIYQRDPTTLSKEERRIAKAIVFCKLFGGGWKTAFKYARNAGSEVTEQEMKGRFDQMGRSFPGLQRTIIRAYEKAERGGPVAMRLPTGLRRVMVGEQLRGSRLLNTMVQGTAAAGMKFALLECQRRGLDKYLSATVHDELVAHVPVAEARDYADELHEAMVTGMEEVTLGKIKVACNPVYGHYWGHDLEGEQRKRMKEELGEVDEELLAERVAEYLRRESRAA